ncbi:hypothetical protein K7432_000917 [Basidiobolus ranarum]
MFNAATSAASTLTTPTANKPITIETTPLSSSIDTVKDQEEPRRNSTPRFPQVQTPTMATATTDLSTASAVTASPPALTLGHLEQFSNGFQNNQTVTPHRSSTYSHSTSEQVVKNLSRSMSARIPNRNRRRSDTTASIDDTFDAEGSNLNITAKKKNSDFHNLFKDVPISEILIQDYSCAIQKDILIHGRMYVTENYICFYASIFGFVSSIVVEFKDVVAIERRNMAFFVPNAILISTLQQKYLFASFMTREAAFNRLVEFWRKNHPSLVENLGYCNSESNLESPYNVSNQVDSTSDSEGSNSDASSEASDETQEVQDAIEPSNMRHPVVNRGGISSLSYVTSITPTPVSKKRTISTGFQIQGDTHKKPTLCDCYETGHFKTLLLDTVIPAPIEKIFELLYGDNAQWIENFLTEHKNKDVSSTPWDGNKRMLHYIMPINVPIGPKHTKCTITEEIDHKDFDKYTSVIATISTPDVPNGTYFNPATRTCLMHAGNGETRMIVTCAITWHKSSWLRGQIERSTMDGSKIVAKNTENAIRRELVDNSSSVTSSEPFEEKKVKKTKKRVRQQGKSEKPEVSHTVLNEARTTLGSLHNMEKLSPSTMILLLVLIILSISNIVSWYHIHTISQRVQFTESHINGPVNFKPESESEPEPKQIAHTMSQSDKQLIGDQLRSVEELLRNIDQKMMNGIESTP